MEERKQAEIDYPIAIGEEGQSWLRTKPFGNWPRETGRLIIDFGYVVQLLDLKPGMRLVELGCGPGWMTRLAARQGVDATGYDIAPEMIAIAREQAAVEGVDAKFEVGDMEELDLGQSFDAALVYDAVHHTPRADLVFGTAHRALKPGGRFLLAEPNWMHRYGGRGAAAEWGTTELGYTPHRFKRLLRDGGFTQVERFHTPSNRLYGNSPKDFLRHLAQPFVRRALGPFWAQIWLRASA